jgi:phosphopantothenoylcysteine decarboxylase/phosphopantothenate--cysteine ligase
MGYAIAQSAQLRGAEVILVSGKTALSAPSGVKVIEVETTKEMFEAVKDNFKNSDTLIMAAAPADFRPQRVESKKIKKTLADRAIKLEETEDILGKVARVKGQGSRKKIIGFALETEDLLKNAKQKLRDKNLDVIVANGPENFDADLCCASIIYKNGKIEDINKMKKEQFADLLLSRLYT